MRSFSTGWHTRTLGEEAWQPFERSIFAEVPRGSEHAGDPGHLR